MTRLGMLTPSSNTALEPVTYAMLSGVEGVSVHSSRFKVTEIALSDSAQAQFDHSEILRAAELLAHAKVDVIAWNYEHAPGVASPRKRRDVDNAVLRAAVLEGHATRHGEAVAEFFDLLLTHLFFVLGLLEFALVDNIHRAFRTHHRDLCCGPGVVDVATHMLAAHHVVSPTIGFASDDCDLGNCGFAIGVEKLGSMTDDAVVFLAHSW